MKKRKTFWNVILIITILLCIAAFTLHYKNWLKVDGEKVSVFSGIFYKQVKFGEMKSITLIERIPPMQRITGFSGFHREKGIFRDSVRNAKAYVFVDNYDLNKIEITYQDSLKLYVNLADSLDTSNLYENLSQRLSTKED